MKDQHTMIKSKSFFCKHPSSQLQTEFKWRDRKGKTHLVSNMETRHLFYTLRMIWNHSAPINLRLEPYQKYFFSPSKYSATYIRKAAKHIFLELSRRTDLQFLWVKELKFMERNFKNFKEVSKLTCSEQ